jgi:hypothetical protein
VIPLRHGERSRKLLDVFLRVLFGLEVRMMKKVMSFPKTTNSIVGFQLGFLFLACMATHIETGIAFLFEHERTYVQGHAWPCTQMPRAFLRQRRRLRHCGPSARTWKWKKASRPYQQRTAQPLFGPSQSDLSRWRSLSRGSEKMAHLSMRRCDHCFAAANTSRGKPMQ